MCIRDRTRDAQSNYFINNTKCRRRDVQDIFLGTGLGPSSYAIIEQGMVCNLVSEKPDELRTHIEEAAGVSKYRERRRETESRIKRTKENLSRVKDIKDEISRLIKRLENQAKAAEKYKNTLGAQVGKPIDQPEHGVTVIFVELPNKDLEVKKDQEIVVIESVKAASDILAPLDGVITEINDSFVVIVIHCGAGTILK